MSAARRMRRSGIGVALLALLLAAIPLSTVAQDASPGPEASPPPAVASEAPASSGPPAGDAEAYVPPHDKPGPAAERLLYNAFFVDRAPLDIENGNMDIYLYSLKTEAAQELRDVEGIELIQAPANTVSLILNPAPAREGELNPFSIPEVRRAMQYLVDRD